MYINLHKIYTHTHTSIHKIHTFTHTHTHTQNIHTKYAHTRTQNIQTRYMDKIYRQDIHTRYTHKICIHNKYRKTCISKSALQLHKSVCVCMCIHTSYSREVRK